jgi:prepilin-type processing-associated H-X9-DG protein
MKLAIQIVAGIFAIWLYMFLFVLPWGNDKESAKRTACLSNTKQQGLALTLYVEDNGGHYPPREAWKDLTRKYLVGETSKYALRCPVLGEGAFGYAFNSALSGQKVPPTPETVPVVYDSSNLTRNASDRFASLPSPGRHKGKNNVGYADGHAKAVAMEGVK